MNDDVKTLGCIMGTIVLLLLGAATLIALLSKVVLIIMDILE